MSTIATLVEVKVTNSIPQNLISEFEIASILADTTSLITIEIPALYTGSSSYLTPLNTITTGSCNKLILLGINISCNSTNYDISILNKNDIIYLNTIYEVIKYTRINKTMSDTDFNNLIICNKDTITADNLYLYIENKDSISTGVISLELTYIAMS